MTDGAEEADWAAYEGKTVVVDTDSNFVYIGTLVKLGDEFVYMEGVDVHDRSETPSTKEQYVLDCKRHGVKPNRKEVAVRRIKIVSLSLLDDVVEY